MLIRNSQIGVEIQADEDTPATLASGDFSGNTSEHSFDYNFEYAERNITRASMTPLGALPSGRMGTIKCTEEVVGGNALISTDAPWHRKVRIGGFSVTQLSVLQCSWCMSADGFQQWLQPIADVAHGHAAQAQVVPRL